MASALGRDGHRHEAAVSTDTGYRVATQGLQVRGTGKQGGCEGSETARTLTANLVNEKPSRCDRGCPRGFAKISYWNVVALSS